MAVSPSWLDFWAPALTSTMVVSAIGFAIGVLWKSSVEKSIQHAFDRKLEALRGEIRVDEERLRAQFREADAQLQALRTGALSNFTARQSELARRRLTATENLWASIIEMDKFRLASTFSQSIKFELLFEEKTLSESDREGLKRLAEIVLTVCGLEKVEAPARKSELDRLFIDPGIWALFSAYQQIVAYPFVVLSAMKAGADFKMLADPKGILDVAKSALPHQGVNIDKFGIGFIPYMPDELRERLFKAIQASLSGNDQDADTIENSAEILRKVAELEGGRKRHIDVAAPLRATPDGKAF